MGLLLFSNKARKDKAVATFRKIADDMPGLHARARVRRIRKDLSEDQDSHESGVRPGGLVNKLDDRGRSRTSLKARHRSDESQIVAGQGRRTCALGSIDQRGDRGQGETR